MSSFKSFSGELIEKSSLPSDGERCDQLYSLKDSEGALTNFVIRPQTYVVDQKTMKIGDTITGFYDADKPVPLIYPPQYEAAVVAFHSPGENITVDLFDASLVSSDGQLRLNVSKETPIVLEDNQTFTGDLSNRILIVRYGIATRSIPAQTTPTQIIVLY